MIAHRSLCFLVLIATFSLLGQRVSVSEGDILKEMGIIADLQEAQLPEVLNKVGIFSQPALIIPTANKVPLLQAYPQLQESVAHVSLGTLPTPVERAYNVEALFGDFAPSLYIKRDDLSGGYNAQGEKLYGGNKVRKLEFLLGEALAYGTDEVITFGCVGSNHAIATAVYAKELGMKCAVFLKPQPNSQVVRNNLLLHLLNKSHVYYYEGLGTRKLGAILHWINHYYKSGVFPYLIPTGGSTPLGALGFVNAAFELKEQIDQGILPMPEVLYVACGSKGTVAGLLLGCKAACISATIMAICVEKPPCHDAFKEDIIKLVSATNALLHDNDPTFPFYDFSENDLMVRHEFSGAEYGYFTPEGAHALRLIKAAENIEVEGTYTAKALAALFHDVQEGMLVHKKVLFWNTYANVSYEKELETVSYTKLPVACHKFFEEQVQELDLQS